MKKAQSKRKPTPKAKPSTALAIRKPKPAQVVIHVPQGLMPMIGQLGEVATVGALGLAELTLTDKEELVLSRSVNTSDVMVKPDGVAYLPHMVYTKWMHDAFGRTGWAIVPTGKPVKGGNLVIVPYLLYIHGRPVAMAYGEQDYFEDNKRQSYGDAIESTIASALRRCAKRLGIGLELWDKKFLRTFQDDQCVRVNVKRRDEVKQEWRRRDDPPLAYEIGTNERPSKTKPQTRQTEPEADNRDSFTLKPEPVQAVITKEQWERLGRIAEKHGRAEAEVRVWLKSTYGELRKIAGTHYAAIVKALEGRGPLPMRGDNIG